MELLSAIGAIILSSTLIYFAGEKFAKSSSNIGDYLGLPRDVKGATFDAVSSSLPELLVALYSVIFFKQFEVGVGTIAGSALFNLLVIPGIAVLVAPVAFKVSKKVISRDALYYIASVFILTVLLIYFKHWGLGVALVLIVFYLAYIGEMTSHALTTRNKEAKKKEISIVKEGAIFIVLLGVIGICTFFLTEYAIALATILEVPAIIIAFTVIAAATSVPDTVISIVNAKQGNIDDATSNIFGSNIFDIAIGIGIPLLIYYLYKGAVEITFANLEIVLGLLGATILVIHFFSDDRSLNKKQGVILLLMYLLFIAYTIFLAIQ